MSELTDNPFIAGMEEVRKTWGWFLALGILFVLLGAACITFDITATYTTVLVFGWMLLIGGVFALVQAFTIGSWSGFFFYLFGALLRGFTGYLLVRYPVSGAAGITLVLASFFVVGGTFRAIGSSMAKFPQWGWAVFSGIISVALGIMLLTQWPVVSIWFIGFAIGVDLIFDGAALTAFASAIHNLPHAGMTFKHA